LALYGGPQKGSDRRIGSASNQPPASNGRLYCFGPRNRAAPTNAAKEVHMDFNVVFTYQGSPTTVGNVQAATKAQALKLARQIYGPQVTVSKS